MKRVLVIVPFPMSEENRDQRRAQLTAVELGPGIMFEFESVRAAPRNYVSAADMALAEIGVLEAGLSAQARGYDAVCIDTMSDSGVAALRSALNIPVIGPGRASVLTAMMLGNRFSILAMWPHWKHLYTKTLTDLGLSNHCASIRWIDATPDNQALMAGKEEDIFPALEAMARRCITEDGAEVILLGSTTMHQAHAYLAARLPVPVVNPGPLTYKLAEAMLGLGLTHSRAAYPTSLAPKDDVIHAMLEAAAKIPH
ncbi:MAG: aspartate/glutamate racemase family protein [Rhodobacteraceae bacterium]|nr:aspartate/glutamate racemase family protein [Paracoccaceae bacterium]MCF8514109.1 aspartate/glutamate racemase family protein [Paracoccaceae bacterium]MCF8518353.1 aspartate/glutamate racemase family protein [Paracoccaceae bacterium]